MSLWQAVVLGVVQGLTEFLPVSSSGHLVIFQHILGVKEPPLTFDVMVHVGTLVAVVAAFWPEVVAIVRKPFSRITFLIIVGCIPAGVMGVFLGDIFEHAFKSLLVVGLGLIVTGIFLVVGERLAAKSGGKNEASASVWDALFVGLMQGIAITPGISRLGSTIAGSLLAGFDREFAASFSFLLSIPVILGAALLQLKDLSPGMLAGDAWLPLVVGPVVAAVSGYLAIRLVVGFLKRGRLPLFAWYCWAVGLITLAWNFLRG